MIVQKSVFVPITEKPFYREEKISFEFSNHTPTLVENMRREAERKGIKLYEISSAGTDKTKRFSAFFLPVKVDEGFVLPLEAVYQYSKVWDGVEPVDIYSLRERFQGLGFQDIGRVSKSYSREMRNRPFLGFVLRLGDVSKPFVNNPPDAFYNWLYIYSVRQNEPLYEGIKNTFRSKSVSDVYPGYRQIAFSDIYFARGAFANQAKALAMLVGMQMAGIDVDSMFPKVSSLRDLIDKSLDDVSFKSFLSTVYE